MPIWVLGSHTSEYDYGGVVDLHQPTLGLELYAHIRPHVELRIVDLGSLLECAQDVAAPYCAEGGVAATELLCAQGDELLGWRLRRIGEGVIIL